MTTNMDGRAELLTSDSELCEAEPPQRRQIFSNFSLKRQALAEVLPEMPTIRTPNSLLSNFIFDGFLLLCLGCALVAVGGSVVGLIFKLLQLAFGVDP